MCVRLSDGKILWQSTNDYEDTVSPQEAADIRRQRAEAQGLRQQLKPVEAELNNLKQEVQDITLDIRVTEVVGIFLSQVQQPLPVAPDRSGEDAMVDWTAIRSGELNCCQNAFAWINTIP